MQNSAYVQLKQDRCEKKHRVGRSAIIMARSAIIIGRSRQHGAICDKHGAILHKHGAITDYRGESAIAKGFLYRMEATEEAKACAESVLKRHGSRKSHSKRSRTT
jgi:hypothetical protein